MNRKLRTNSRVGLAAGKLALIAFAFGLGSVNAVANDEEVGIARFRPRWDVGQRWRLEVTASRSPLARRSIEMTPAATIWEFTVTRREPLANCECFRVEGRPTVAKHPDAPLVFWAECDRLVLRQIELRIPTAQGIKSLIERYDFPQGESTPVIGLLNAVPIALPVFRDTKTKSATAFAYDVRTRDDGESAADAAPWRFPVRQEWKPLPMTAVKGASAKGHVPAGDRLSVELESPLSRVRQVWQAGQPWSVLSDNGVVVARLIDDPASR